MQGGHQQTQARLGGDDERRVVQLPHHLTPVDVRGLGTHAGRQGHSGGARGTAGALGRHRFQSGGGHLQSMPKNVVFFTKLKQITFLHIKILKISNFPELNFNNSAHTVRTIRPD